MKFANVILLLLVLLLFSCKYSSQKIVLDDVLGKWRTIRNDTIQSIEFNESKSYILEEKDEAGKTNVYYGDFEIIDKTSIELVDYGTLINFVSFSEALDFTVKKSTGQVFEFASEKVSEIISQTISSESICQTWKLIKVEGIVLEEVNVESHAIFSQVGTYAVANITNNECVLHNWMWKDDSEEILCYSESETPECGDPKSEIKILKLEEDTLAITHMNKLFEMIPLVEE